MAQANPLLEILENQIKINTQRMENKGKIAFRKQFLQKLFNFKKFVIFFWTNWISYTKNDFNSCYYQTKKPISFFEFTTTSFKNFFCKQNINPLITIICHPEKITIKYSTLKELQISYLDVSFTYEALDPIIQIFLCTFINSSKSNIVTIPLDLSDYGYFLLHGLGFINICITSILDIKFFFNLASSMLEVCNDWTCWLSPLIAYLSLNPVMKEFFVDALVTTKNDGIVPNRVAGDLQKSSLEWLEIEDGESISLFNDIVVDNNDDDNCENIYVLLGGALSKNNIVDDQKFNNNDDNLTNNNNSNRTLRHILNTKEIVMNFLNKECKIKNCNICSLLNRLLKIFS